ncbi:ATP-binding protein [Actinomadura namibiensis]|uniref:Two-component sensor histidine kinase n=1 Tax=Actinomadura namibiensis TaxID=182080 RepID=A0A7W3QKC4_ACTNM|nr:ATP-binding protein [Actinomadura namibiensis]MBA8950384.1 two-component sensor histidine kinase [Actinomadura namibiensis]
MNLLGVISLPGVARSAPEARAFVRRVVGDGGDLLGDLVLCVDELVANACEHTASGRGGRVSMLVEGTDGALRVTVVDDSGSATKPCVRTEVCGEDGRGLRLVEALSSGWGVAEAGGGTAVWVEFRRR